MSAMAAVSNVYRAANAVRNHLERTVLAPHGLTWTGWVVLWVIWIGARSRAGTSPRRRASPRAP